MRYLNFRRAAQVAVEPYDNAVGAWLVIVDDEGAQHVFWCGPGECRALHRAGARALGYAHIRREYREWTTTREAKVAQKIEPLLVLASSLFPKPKAIKKAAG